MELSSLRFFKTVADSQSISAAARQLHCVQSNVTNRIRQLEDDLAVSLFYRRSRGVALTPAGQRLLGYAEKMLQLAEEARQAVLDDQQPKGRLRLGSMETTAAVRLPKLLVDYHQVYPEVELSLQTGTSEDVIKKILNYEIDAGLVGGQVEHPEIIQELAFEEELVLLLPPECERPEEIIPTRAMLVFRSGCTYRARLESWLKETGMRPAQILEFGTLEAILGCVRAGMGITLLPRFTVQRLVEPDSLTLHSIDPKFGLVPTMCIRRRDTYVTAALRAFMQSFGH